MRAHRALGPGAVAFINAQLCGGNIGTVRIVGARIASLSARPRAKDLIVDLQGDRLLPGLINAHDHLQLNSLPALESGHQYRHAREWIADVAARRRSDPAFEACVAVARDHRLAVGGVKNLLSGVTTVAHHDRLYPLLSDPAYPVRVVQEFGWAHSLYVDGESAVRASYQSTPIGRPWIIHAAEGLDAEAVGEFERLEALGCLGPNTLIVHGVALDRGRRLRLVRAGAGLIWCPSSNLRLFGKTVDASELAALGRVALGTDSRLSGARDLLAELRIAARIGGLSESRLVSLVTRDSARLLRLADRGALRAGARADLLILPSDTPLGNAERADVRLVLRGGIARYGDPRYAEMLAPAAAWVGVRVDGREKLLERRTAALLAAAPAPEHGLELTDAVERAA